jgi:hypothetical protein
MVEPNFLVRSSIASTTLLLHSTILRLSMSYTSMILNSSTFNTRPCLSRTKTLHLVAGNVVPMNETR